MRVDLAGRREQHRVDDDRRPSRANSAGSSRRARRSPERRAGRCAAVPVHSVISSDRDQEAAQHEERVDARGSRRPSRTDPRGRAAPPRPRRRGCRRARAGSRSRAPSARGGLPSAPPPGRRRAPRRPSRPARACASKRVRARGSLPGGWERGPLPHVRICAQRRTPPCNGPAGATGIVTRRGSFSTLPHAAHPDHRGGGRLAGLLHRRSCAVAHPAPRHRRRVLLPARRPAWSPTARAS